MYPHEHTTIFRFSPPCYEHILLKITTYRNRHSLYSQLYPPSHEKTTPWYATTHTHIIIIYPPYLDKMTKKTSSPTKNVNFVIQKNW
jgi:hypothetical protein